MTTAMTAVTTLCKRLWSFVPSGGSLPESVWRSRRRFLVGLTWFHAIVIALSGPILGHRWELSIASVFEHATVLHTLGEALVVATFAMLGSWRAANRTFQATAIGFGLMSSSAVMVHLSGGYIEAHFHFFVMLAFLALFQDWIPYLLSVAFVAVHHGVVGVLWPEEVYNHDAAFASPWTWAAIHAFFVLASCVGSVIAWRFNERAFAQTALILEAAGEGIFGLDERGTVVFMNPAAAGMLRTDVRRAVNRPLEDILTTLGPGGIAVPTDRSAILAPVTGGEARHASDEMFVRPDGTTFSVDYVSTPMIERGEITGVVVTFQDITARKRAAAELQRSHRQLEETLAELKRTQTQVLQQERLRAMGQMASGIAHDFNNTLSPIMGFSELLLRRPVDNPEQLKGYVQLINTAARDAAAVVRRLRELYRERDEHAVTASIDLGACIEEAVALTQPRWRNQALASGITIQVETDAKDAPVISGDPAEIREALTNLIFNAVDAMPLGGRICVSASVEDGDIVRLAVSDTGVGMPDDVRQRCMDPFFSTKGPHGTGLGLSLVHGIIERHGGTCAIESTVGLGTTFIVRLPVPVPGARPAADAEAQAEARSRRLRILLVEDEPLVRRTLTEMLAHEGHTVDCAANGLEGLEKLMSARFDLVITDRAMPEMSGDQLAAAIKRLAPDKPVIMLTGFGDLMLARNERPTGVSVVVSKPATGDALRDAIAQATAAAAV